MSAKTYYHIIEEFSGNIGHQGYTTDKAKAEAEVERLEDLFEGNTFWVFTSDSKSEPSFITV
jgi:hypothetical protein